MTLPEPRRAPGAVAAPAPDEAVAFHYGNPAREARAWAAGTALVDLSNRDVVVVSGPDRLTWLHAFTSQHLAALAPGASVETLILSPHGHIEHAAAVVDDGESTYLLLDVGAGPALVAFLEKMRFAARVDVTARPDLATVATRAPAAAALGILAGFEVAGWEDPWPRTSGTSYAVADAAHPGADWQLRLSLVERSRLGELRARWEAAGHALAGLWAFEAARVAAWRPRFAREVDERSIPHELDWLRTAVHLHKGCYRGQETVARVINLGRPPRRLVLLHLDGSAEALPAPGSEVLPRSGGRAVGHVTSSARHFELGPLALAVVKRSLAEDAELLVRAVERTPDGSQAVEVAAAQEVIVPAAGVSRDTPAVRPGSALRPLRRGGLQP